MHYLTDDNLCNQIFEWGSVDTSCFGPMGIQILQKINQT